MEIGNSWDPVICRVLFKMKGNEMSYTYPDKDDRLTCQLIEKEFDGEYWAESEELVLEGRPFTQ